MNSSSNKIKVGIVGAAGYTGGELLRLLIRHPQVQVAWAQSRTYADQPLWKVHADLLGDSKLCFVGEGDLTAIDLLFLCTPHGESSRFLSTHSLSEELRIIDLSHDFRDESQGFIYGQTDLNAARLATARRVANPGCFATAIELALLPAAAAGAIAGEVHVTAITGSTGAGVQLSTTTHHSRRADNLSVYKAFEHQHLAEIDRVLQSLAHGRITVNFVPMRGDFQRGILASVYFSTPLNASQAFDLYRDYYAHSPFTTVTPHPIELKQVINTNKALLNPVLHEGKLHIVSCIDNLLKGASGQAVENMNRMFGLNPDAGLRLKSSGF